jgi:hypothetical protein
MATKYLRCLRNKSDQKAIARLCMIAMAQYNKLRKNQANKRGVLSVRIWDRCPTQFEVLPQTIQVLPLISRQCYPTGVEHTTLIQAGE